MFIHNNINTRVFTPYSTMIKTKKVIRVLLPILQSSRFLYNLSTSFASLPFSHALSTTHPTLSLPSISCHPSTISFINLTISFLCLLYHYSAVKCSTSSTIDSLPVHKCLHAWHTMLHWRLALNAVHELAIYGHVYIYILVRIFPDRRFFNEPDISRNPKKLNCTKKSGQGKAIHL